jgi:DNA-binding XRE family transcriptional regulator
MPPNVLLVTDRPRFEQQWRASLAEAGLQVSVSSAEAFSADLDGHAAVVFDAGSEFFTEDELLANLALACACRLLAAVELPDSGTMAEIEFLLDDLCPGLVARNEADIARIAGAIARRCDSDRGRRFEYVAISPRPGELLAILGDGTSVLLPRPLGEEDDGEEVTSILIAEDAAEATLELKSGRRISISAAEAAASRTRRELLSGAQERPSPGAPSGTLGERLRKLRLAAGLTQAELARRTGIHRPNIARVEAGRHTPSLETLNRLASAIGVPTARVLSEE